MANDPSLLSNDPDDEILDAIYKLAELESDDVDPYAIKASDRIPLEEQLDRVSYEFLADGKYEPSDFALMFTTFVKLVKGDEGEDNTTPPFHMAMLDQMTDEPSEQILNLVFRGGAKTTIWAEYLIPFVAVFQKLPGLPKITGIIYVSDTMENGVKSLRANLETRYEESDFLRKKLPHIRWTENEIVFTNENGKKTGLKMYGAEQGIRGSKIFGKRPQLCIMDDLMSDKVAESQAAMKRIRATVHKGIKYALDPKRRKIIFNGTPFNSEDIIVSSAESPAWKTNVWPVAEKWPCTREEFRGAWEDRFDYDTLMKQYTEAVEDGVGDAFMQELMLRITSAEERLVQESEIQWYNRKDLLARRHNYNVYITTDFSTSEKQSADFSVISVWAINAIGQWYWLDGVCERMTMDKTLDHLFRLVGLYKPQTVGIERSGQQGAFVPWIQQQMMHRNIWFTLALDPRTNQPGIVSQTDKLSRFNLVVPLFKAGKMFFPNEMKESQVLKLGMAQIKLATGKGLKGKDDFLDTVSMLAFMQPWLPTMAEAPKMQDDAQIWDLLMKRDDAPGGLASYIV